MPRDAADSGFIDTLSQHFPADMFSRAEQSYLEEPRGRFQGAQGFVARPRNTQEVAALVKACNETGVGVVPYGGGTGLVGGQIAPEGDPETPLILSLERMTQIRAVYPQENVLIADAGPYPWSICLTMVPTLSHGLARPHHTSCTHSLC